MRITTLRRYLAFALLFVTSLAAFGQSAEETVPSDDSLQQAMLKYYLDSIDKTMDYRHGKTSLNDVASLDIPAGYKFIPASKSQMLLHDIWRNPEDKSVLGMVVKEDFSLSNFDQWAFVVSYSEDGYVKDEDADKINYDDLLKDIQKSEEESNPERVKQGYPEIHLLGWASTPYYDKKNKVLHWAKKLQFSGSEEPGLNYDVRILGRKGVLSMNAVGEMQHLEDIKKHIPDILAMSKFTDGNRYSDFNPSMDKVAAYTIGGLIAGKLIAKTGLLVLLLKNIKLILLAAFGGFAAMRNKIAGLFRRKKKEEPYKPEEAVAIAEPAEPSAEDPQQKEL